MPKLDGNDDLTEFSEEGHSESGTDDKVNTPQEEPYQNDQSGCLGRIIKYIIEQWKIAGGIAIVVALAALYLTAATIAPRASFTVQQVGITPFSIEIIDNSDQALRYEWDMGDGQTRYEEISFSYTYDGAGEYTIQLNVWGRLEFLGNVPFLGHLGKDDFSYIFPVEDIALTLTPIATSTPELTELTGVTPSNTPSVSQMAINPSVTEAEQPITSTLTISPNITNVLVPSITIRDRKSVV